MSEAVTNVEYLYNAAEDPDVIGRFPRFARVLKDVVEAVAESANPFDEAVAASDDSDAEQDAGLLRELLEAVRDAANEEAV